MSKRLLYLLCMALACGVLVAACGGDDDEGGGEAGSQETGATEGAKAVDPASMENASGDVTVCMGKDTAGDITEAVKEFNAQGNGVTVELLEFSTSADEQRTQFVQRQEAKSGECDVFSSDVIWTAEFASQKWLLDMTPYIETAQGRDHRGDARERELRRQVLGHAAADRRGVPVLPHRPGQGRRLAPGRRSTRSRARTTASSTRARRTRA